MELFISQIRGIPTDQKYYARELALNWTPNVAKYWQMSTNARKHSWTLNDQYLALKSLKSTISWSNLMHLKNSPVFLLVCFVVKRSLNFGSFPHLFEFLSENGRFSTPGKLIKFIISEAPQIKKKFLYKLVGFSNLTPFSLKLKCL